MRDLQVMDGLPELPDTLQSNSALFPASTHIELFKAGENLKISAVGNQNSHSSLTETSEAENLDERWLAFALDVG